MFHSSTPTTNSPSFLQASESALRERSRSRDPRRRRAIPPRPIVEDEAVSLARESSSSALTHYEPPLRGIIDQHPIILEADVSAAEAARLHAGPRPKEKDENAERRFVLIPQSDTYSPSREDAPPKAPRLSEAGKQPGKNDKENVVPRPPIERRRSRQDLPSLQTKVPRDIPPQFRRSASAYSSRENDETPKAVTPSTLLSPDVRRNPSKDYFGSAPKTYKEESFGGRNGTSAVDKRRSAGGSSRPTTPSEKRNSGNFDWPRSRRSSIEKLTRPQQFSDAEYSRREERHASTHSSSRLSTGSDRRSGRTSPGGNRHYQSSSESDITDSDSDRSRRRHRHRRHRELQVEDDRRRSSSRSRTSGDPSSSGDLKPSRYKTAPSPRASPNQLTRGERERAETFPQRSGSRSPVSRPVSPFSPTDETPRPGDRLNPMDSTRPRSRQSQSVSTPSTSATYPLPSASLSSVPISIPMPMPIRASQYDENRGHSARSAEQKPSWQPPAFQPPSNSLQKPIGTYRRHSEDVERGTIAPLPSCPRTTFKQGLNDWLTLPQCPSFDICPSCFNSTIAPTEFRNFFVPAPRRGPETEVVCDFGSSPWYRIAWLLTRKERRRDLNLFYGLAHIAANAPPCLGKNEAIRQWHSLIDPKSRHPIHNFHVCYSCVKSVETLLPAVRGIFVRIDPKRPMGDPRVCNLRFDSKRFIQYFDALETTADKAEEEQTHPDTRALASLAKRMSMFPECEHDKELLDQPWNIITQLPEFTVCEECFDEVVWPELDDKKAIPMMFKSKPQILPRASCQLYSPKMRGIFRTAVDGDDYKFLAQKARERKAVETKHKKDVEALKRLSKMGNQQGVHLEIKRLEEEWKKWE